ncbi:MAG TPA: hypothetical protein VHI98_18925, partial [Vicinamibacterales bacterium]|nr:hypothetical protein [Vicinamibacterales bacterium]
GWTLNCNSPIRRARFVKPETAMDPKHPDRQTRTPPRAGAPLADLVENDLNKPLAEQVADEISERADEPARTGADDYARGTAEHEDDNDTP